MFYIIIVHILYNYLISEDMGRKLHAVGYELVPLWLRNYMVRTVYKPMRWVFPRFGWFSRVRGTSGLIVSYDLKPR